MEVPSKKKLYLMSGRSHLPLAEEIAGLLDEQLIETNLSAFSNGEIHCRFGESVRGADVFIIQSHSSAEGMSINDSVMEQLIMVDAARRASAKRIVAVCPFYGYARQDRKAEGREPITARLVADMFAVAGASRLMSVDLHSGQIQGFFSGPVDHLVGMPVLIEQLSKLGSDVVMVSPDAGRAKVAERYAQVLHADFAMVHKRRVKGAKHVVEAADVVGEVEGRTCVLIDDMIDTAGTMCAAAEQLIEHGATEVLAAATHAVLSGEAVDRLKNSVISRVIVTNTLPLPPEKQFDKLEVLSIAGLVANAIDAVFEDLSVSEIFDGRNQQ